jgi:NAD+ synthase (glutamine-hydrolysing)
VAVAMPSPYSSRESVEDAQKLADTLNVTLKIIPITSVYQAYLQSLKDPFADKHEDETEENIQARIRGNIIMALSNKFGYLPLASGNKSELAVGYCTLYGDMSGGLGVLADVPKTMIYRLAKYINRDGEIIPRRIMEKPPSAELKPGQRDEDTLPPYDILDQALNLYLDGECSRNEIISEGIASETVDWVIDAVNNNEYKRRQGPPGLKITSKAFGTGRRMPIAARFEESG